MSEPRASWTGLSPDELARRIEHNPFSARRVEMMTKITFVALAHSQPLTPVRTGTLRRSETTRVETDGLRGWIGTNVKYAPFVHARVPFFAQGIAESGPEILQILQKVGDGYLKDLT